jgi:hypothetical protein
MQVARVEILAMTEPSRFRALEEGAHNETKLTDPSLIGSSRFEVTIQDVGGDRAVMPAIGRRLEVTTLSPCQAGPSA